MEKTEKQKLRERILALLREQDAQSRFQKSLFIFKKLLQTKEFQEARKILFYASFDGEVDTFEMMKHAMQLKKAVFLPVIDHNNKRIVPSPVRDLEQSLDKNVYGILEPRKEESAFLRENSFDMAVVPGVAFDRYGNRLGRGGGYYDRFLRDLPRDMPKIGLAFDFQVVDSLKDMLEPHDVPVSCVLTN